MANLFEKLLRQAIKRPSPFKQTTVPQGMSATDLAALAGTPATEDKPKKEQSTGKRATRAILGTLLAGALGPSAVQFGAGAADIYSQDKQRREKEEALRQLAAANAAEKKADREEKTRKAAEESSLKSQRNMRDWMKLGGSAVDWMADRVAPKQKQFSPADEARAKYYDEQTETEKAMRPGRVEKLSMARVLKGAGRSGGGDGVKSPKPPKEEKVKPVSQVQDMKVDSKTGQMVKIPAAEKSVQYENRVRPVVSRLKRMIEETGTTAKDIFKPKESDPTRKPIDDYLDKYAPDIPPADRALVIRQIANQLGYQVPLIQQPMEAQAQPFFNYEWGSNLLGGYDPLTALSEWSKPKRQNAR